MFQNISNNDAFEDTEVEENKINLLLKEVFKPCNCVIYILTFLLSMIEIKNEVLPFGLAIVGACLGSTIPIFMVYVVSIISVSIFHGGAGFANYFYTSLIFFLLIIMFKPKISTEDRNEVFKVGTRLFSASFIYCIIKNIKGAFLAVDIFSGFIISLLTYVFYKIFVNGIVVIRDFPKKNAFTIEEIVAALIIFSIAVSNFSEILIFNYSISSILIVLLIFVIGLKNGINIGGISGLAVGTSLTLISNVDIFQLMVFTASGILSGILGHILMPEKFKVEIAKSENLLGNNGERRFNYYEEIKEKLNAVTQTITDMNNNFFIKNSDISNNLNKEIYIDNFLSLLENYPQNVFYEDILNNENLIRDFFDSLEKEDVITEREMLEIFRKYNNYILLRDKKLKDDLQEIIKIANRTFRELQINSVKAKVKAEESQKLENELKSITNMISNITQDESKFDEFDKKEKEIVTLLKGKMYPIKKVVVNRCKNGKYIIKLNFEFKDESIREKNKITNIETLISRSLGTKIAFQKDKKNLTTGDYIQVYSADDKFSLQVGSTKVARWRKREY